MYMYCNTNLCDCVYKIMCLHVMLIGLPIYVHVHVIVMCVYVHALIMCVYVHALIMCVCVREQRNSNGCV